MKKIIHPIKPIFNKESKILFLGSFPSITSRKNMFYYAHPQNRFWKVLSIIFNEDNPSTIEEKTNLLLKHNIALWDVIKSCTINGSSDASISNVVVNDLDIILKHANISKIFVDGKTAKKYYDKYIYPKTKIDAILLPSTSSANATYSLEKLVEEYKKIIYK